MSQILCILKNPPTVPSIKNCRAKWTDRIKKDIIKEVNKEYKPTNPVGNVTAVKKYKINHIEMNRTTSATYQKKKKKKLPSSMHIAVAFYQMLLTKNHKISQYIQT
jgi:adenine C2-methylase RlmN of 23S rRNA A2503 and tRNA A37